MDWNVTGKRTGLILITAGVFFLCAGCGKADSYYEQAINYMNEGKYEEAGEQFELAIGENEERAEYYIGQGMVLNFTGKYQEALEVFSKQQSDADNKISNENNKQMYYGEAVAYYGLGDYEAVIDCCGKALEISEKEEMDCDIRCLQAAAYELRGDSEKALALYEENIKSNPKDVESYLESGRLQLVIGQYDAAQEDFEKVLELDKENAEAYFGRYDVCIAKKDSQTAESILTEFLKKEPESAEDYIASGKANYLLGRNADAERDFVKAEEMKAADAPYYQGLLLMSGADYDGAVKKFQDFLDGEGDKSVTDAEAYNQIAGCMMEQRRYQEAVEYLEKGISCGRTEAHEALSRNLVLAYEKTGKYKKARKAAKEYLKIYPQNGEMQKELTFIRTRIVKGGKK